MLSLRHKNVHDSADQHATRVRRIARNMKVARITGVDTIHLNNFIMPGEQMVTI